MMNPYSLENKTIFVTGASSGIGKATALVCAQLGATLIITGRNEERLNGTLKELNAISEKPHQMVVADLTEKAEMQKLVEQLPKIDGISCNTGITKALLIKFIKDEDIHNLFETNTFSQVNLIQSLIKNKKFNKPSSVVLTASIGGVICYVNGNAIYGMSKAALNSFMKYAAIEFSGKQIRFNSVCPGMIETNMTQSINELSEEDEKRHKQEYLLKRYGRPEEVAYAICFLLSDASSFITGQSIVIDGGYSINH